MEPKGQARFLLARDDPLEPHRGWSMIPHNSVVFRDSSELWRSNTLHTINHIKKRMVDIFKQYPDLYAEMIEEKRDAEMLKLFKSVQPQIADVKVKPTQSAEVPKKAYTSDGKSKFLYPHY